MTRAFGMSVLLLAFSLPLSAQTDTDTALENITSALQDKRFSAAVQQIDAALAASTQKDYLLYLKGLALFYDKNYQTAIAACDQLLTEHPDSAWRQKATFLKAQCYFNSKAFDRAEEIYRAEVERLLSSKRKSEMAQVYIDLAEAVSRKPDPNQPDAPPPNYEKAYNFYQQALALEIDTALRDELRFRLGRMRQMAGQYAEAIGEYRNYLTEFDPDFQTSPTPSLTTAKPQTTGKHRYSARYHLAQCQIANQEHLLARITLEDLLKILPAAEVGARHVSSLLKDARYTLIEAHRFPTPQSLEELELGAKTARHFIADFPADPRAVRLAYQIGQAYQSRRQSEAALKAYQAFLAGEGFSVTPETTETYAQLFEDATESFNEMYQRLRMDAAYQIGEIQFNQANYPAAIAAWQAYIRDFPNGPHWTAAQQRIIDAEYQTGVALLTEEKYADAIRAFDAFQAAHPLDERVRQISLIYAQIHAHNADKLIVDGEISYGAKESSAVSELRFAEAKTEYRKAIAEWEKLVSKYPGTEESSLALFRVGVTHEEKLGDMENALKSYRKLMWGTWRPQAEERIRQMTQKRLQLATQRTFRANEPAKVHLSLRNIEKLTVNLYRLNLEAYWRKTHGIQGVENLDLALIAPDKTWEYAVQGYAKYKPFELDVEIPIEGPGVYAVHVSEEDYEATTLVVRSNIEAIVKTSRKEVLVFAQDMVRGQAAPNATVLVSDGQRVILEGETGTDGVYHQKHDALKDAENVSAFVVKEGHVASDLLNLSGLGLSKGLTARGFIYTDRSAYRPGQTVSIRGVLRDVVDGSYAVRPGEKYTVSVVDAQGRVLREETLALSEFGTFTTEIALDENAALGEYRIQAQLAEGSPNASPSFSGTFLVQRFQLEKIQLTLDFPREVYFRGEQVEATFIASYYYGQPVRGAQIQYVLPNGQTFTAPVDDEGKLKITFDTTLMQPGPPLRFSGTVVGENVYIAKAVTLAYLGFSISVSAAAEVVLSGEPVDVTVKTVGADGKPVAETVNLAVLRKTRQPAHPIISQIPHFNRGGASEAEVLVETHQVKTDSRTGEGRAQLTLTEGGAYVLRATGTDRFDQPVVEQGYLTVSDEDDVTKLRIFVERTKTQVGATETVRFHSRLKPTLALVTFEGEGIVDYHVLTLNPNDNPLQFTVGHQHFPNFYLAVAAIDGQQLHTTGKHFIVERQLNLNITWLGGRTQTDYNFEAFPAYLPGAPAEVKIQATDQLGKPVKAELSLALVDEALFAIFPDRLDPIKGFFQSGARREAEMRTVSSCRFSYTPPTQKVIKEALAEDRRLEEMRELERAAGKASPARPQVRQPVTSGLDFLRAEEDAAPTNAPEAAKIGATNGGRMLRQTFFARSRLGDELAMTEAPQVREEFADAGHWLGAVVTDENGVATVTLPMPEKTTQWRLTGRGCTVDTLVGEVKVNAITRKEFFLDLKVPSIVTEGDQLRIHARLHNLTDYEGDAEVKLKVSVDGKETVTPKQVAIAKNATTDLIFDAMTVAPGAMLTVEATATAGTMSDGVRREVPIRPWGMEYADSKSGSAEGDTTVYLELPSDQRYTYKRLTIDIAPSVSRLIFDLAMGGGVIPLRRSTVFPPVSDPGTDLLAVAYALGYVKQVGGYPTDNRALVERARTLVSALVSAQNGDGGWGWVAVGKESDVAVSARNLWALAEIQRQGVPVNSAAISQAIAYMKDRFVNANQRDDETKAVILHALSTVKQADFAYANRLYRNRGQLSASGLAYTALVLTNLDRNEIAGELLDLLEGQNLLSSQDSANVETVALGLLAMQAARPNSPWVAKAVEYLLAQRRWYGYRPYRAKGPATAALATYYGQTQFTENDYRMTVTVNGRELQEIQVNREVPSQTIAVPTEALVEGRNQVSLTLNGRGKYSYAATLSGFSPEFKDPKSFPRPFVHKRHYLYPPLTYNGQSLSTVGNPNLTSSTTEMTQLEAGQRAYVYVYIEGSYTDRYLVVDETLPAGTTFIDGTLGGDFHHHEVGDGRLRLYYLPNRQITGFQYQIVSYAPGDYRVAPTVIHDPEKPGQMRIGPESKLTVLAPGEKSKDVYQMNNPERFALGQAYFNDGKYSEALPLLAELMADNPDYSEQETARMLLWIYTTTEHYNARKVVETFERLRERYPDLYIPFDKIRVVGKAYRDIEEFERAALVHSATIDASFTNDSGISAVLQDEGEFTRSIDFAENLWRTYPDSPTVVPAYFALSQALYAHTEETQQAGARSKRLNRVADMLSQFLTLYPTNALADDAALSLTNAYLDLEDFLSVIELCQLSQRRYPNSDFLSSFQYVEALGLFSLRKYNDAIQAATVVAQSESEDRDFARYILGQVYHAEGKPAQAIEWYTRVKEVYPDANESIAYFEEKRVSLPEVTIKRPDEAIRCPLEYRNIETAAIQVYRVDLMKLYLREKDLSRITEVHLAGIEPAVSQTVTLGDGKDYAEKTRELDLPLKEEGAYLIICRGDDKFASGLLLITPIAIEVQEDVVSGRVRVNVKNTATGTYLSKAHVKAIGSAEQRLISGETDLRGVFIADGVRGKPTVIVRDETSRYAFYRGEQPLVVAEAQAAEQAQRKAIEADKKMDYRMNLNLRNEAIQSSNIEQFEQMRRQAEKGVQVQRAY